MHRPMGWCHPYHQCADFCSFENSEIALLVEKIEDFGGGGILRDGDGEENENVLISMLRIGPIYDRGRRVGFYFFSRIWVKCSGDLWVDDFEVVIELSEGADGRAGGANRVFLLDGNSRWDVVDTVDRRFVHPVEELADVRRECLDISALALGVEGVKCQ